MKELQVITSAGAVRVQLSAEPDAKLTPALARRAAQVAQGGSSGAIVWDVAEGVGYKLYRRGARRLSAES